MELNEISKKYDPFIDAGDLKGPPSLISTGVAPLMMEFMVDWQKVDKTCIVPDKTRDYFDLVRKTLSRVDIELDPSEKLFVGSWYRQWGNTCMALGILNAINIIGKNMDMIYLTEMINRVVCPRPTGKARSGLNFVNTFLEWEVPESMDTNLSMNYDLLSCDLDSSADPDARDYVLKTNARIIKEHIDNGRALIISIENLRLYADLDTTNFHTICLSGYKIDQNRFMDVQLVDSNYGIFCIPLEHFSGVLSWKPDTVSKQIYCWVEPAEYA